MNKCFTIQLSLILINDVDKYESKLECV